jgi:glycyl-tRNA synthetase
MGVELKRNIKNAWWKAIVQERDDVVGIDTSIMMHPRVWAASGHVDSFADSMVECQSCHLRWKAEEVGNQRCPKCGGELTEPRMFNLMFKTFMGPVEEEASTVYLRPETAQGMFVNFANIITTSRKRLPLGIAQIGKSFRNEITPGNFIFRTREFEHMELEYFVKPGTDESWFDFWVKERLEWYIKLGIRQENLRLRQHSKEELAHYAKDCYDIEYLFPMGWSELEGIANRGDYDLTQHAKYSGKDLSYYDVERKERYVPYVIEPSAGVDRSFLAFLIDAYDEEEVEGERRTVLRFHPLLAPIKVAVLPLSRNEKLTPLAKEVYKQLCPSFMTYYDDSQSIGRRYRRQDEIGTPFCVTVDFESLEDYQVTIRERDSLAQIRVLITELEQILQAKFKGEPFEKTPLWATRQK